MDHMDVGQQLLELQVKEKCGNRVVKVILDRIQVSGSVHNPKKYHETCSSPKINLQNQDRSFRDVGKPSSESAPNLDRGRPQRKITKIYTQYFDGSSDSSSDVEDIASEVSGSDSEQKDSSRSEFKSRPLNKAKSKTKNSKKTSTNLETCLQCDLCSLKYKSTVTLENHILNFHVVDKPFECDICFKSFLTEEVLQNHVKRFHEAKKFSSKLCVNKTFAYSASLKIHIETIHRSYSDHSEAEAESTGNNHLCPVCGTCFVTKSDLVKHLQKPGFKSVMKCKLCSEPVHTPCRLNVHLQKMHSATPKAKVSTKRKQREALAESPPAMKQSYSTKETKSSASGKHQVSPNKFSCVACSAFFSRRCDLDLHELHEKHRRWKCPICAKLVNEKRDLKMHIQSVHSDAKPFHCTHKGCCKSFKVSQDLKAHAVMHDPDRVRCKDCFKYFTKKAFPLHVANKHGADHAFKCDFCSKTWGSWKRLKQHLLTHTDERPFPCKFCSARYKCSDVANQHMKKCQVRSEDERKKCAKRSHMVVQQAKTRKPRKYISGSSQKSTGQSQSLKLPETTTPEPKSTCTNELPSATTSLNGNGNGTEVKQEVDIKYFSDNSSDFVDQPDPEPGSRAVKLEIVPKQEMWTYSD